MARATYWVAVTRAWKLWTTASLDALKVRLVSVSR
jgi:hypothetical protein